MGGAECGLGPPPEEEAMPGGCGQLYDPVHRAGQRGRGPLVVHLDGEESLPVFTVILTF